MADPNTPTPDTSSTIAPLDMDWARDELIPFLERVFPHPAKSPYEWERLIMFARHNLDRVPFYEDFPLTIERLRLTLLNSDRLTPVEMSKFMRITEQGSQMCIRIFVRHAVRHGLYRLFSLGRDPSPDFPRPQQPGSVQPATAQPPVPAVRQASAPADTQATVPAVSMTQLADENAALRRQMESLSIKLDRAEGRRGIGRGRAAAVQTSRPPQPRGGYNGRSGRGHHFNQGARMPPAVQQTPAQYTPAPPNGYYQPYAGSSYMYGSYMPTAPMGLYGMQQYQQQQFANPLPQSYGGWDGNQTSYTTQLTNSFQSGYSSAYTMPPPHTTLVPQQVRGPNLQGQAPQQVRGPSTGQPAQVSVQTQGPSVPPHEQASVSGTSTYVPRPDARPFTPGSNTTDD